MINFLDYHPQAALEAATHIDTIIHFAHYVRSVAATHLENDK